jgi:hypothetical protein
MSITDRIRSIRASRAARRARRRATRGERQLHRNEAEALRLAEERGENHLDATRSLGGGGSG